MNFAIDKLTFSEKIQVMEQLWENLSQASTLSQEQTLTPKWHEAVLQQRLEMSKNAENEFVDWKMAKEQLRASIK